MMPISGVLGSNYRCEQQWVEGGKRKESKRFTRFVNKESGERIQGFFGGSGQGHSFLGPWKRSLEIASAVSDLGLKVSNGYQLQRQDA